MRIEAREIILHRRLRVALRIDGDEIRVDLVGILTERAQHLGNLEQRGRADVGAMGEAEEDQGRTALQVLFGNRLAGLVGELERTADRRGCGDFPQVAHQPGHQQKPDGEARGKGRNDHDGATEPFH